MCAVKTRTYKLGLPGDPRRRAGTVRVELRVHTDGGRALPPCATAGGPRLDRATRIGTERKGAQSLWGCRKWHSGWDSDKASHPVGGVSIETRCGLLAMQTALVGELEAGP